MRGGGLEAAPDAVVMPPDAGALRRVLDVGVGGGMAVVPFGGGTSVVGGVERLRGAHQRLISLDLGALRDVAVDRRSLTARLGAGLRGPEAEAALAREGLTLGPFPQSFEYATIGGFAATRSAGQASSGYGRFDALVSSVRLIAPAGELRTLETPHTAAGPSLRELVVGSEGVLGVIPEVTVRVRPAPRVRRYEAWMAESFEAGAEIVRAMAQGPGLPDVVRVSDEEETQGSLALSGPRGLAGRLFGGYLGLRRRLAILPLHRPQPPWRGDRAVATGQARRLGGDRRLRRHHHPPPRRRPRPRPLHGGGGGEDRAGRPPGGQGPARSQRDHEPRKADPLI